MSQPRLSFTILELMLVLVVIGIITAFAIPGYRGAREKALKDEARSMLVLVRAAERMERLEEDNYADCTDTADFRTYRWGTAGRCHPAAMSDLVEHEQDQMDNFLWPDQKESNKKE